MDAFYTYCDHQRFEDEGSFTIGAQNMFDREAQRTDMKAGIIGELQDPLGRVFYARF